MPKRDPIEVVEGFFLGHVVQYLHDQGVLRRLQRPTSVDELAIELGCDRNVLHALLDFARQATDFVACDADGRYRLASRYLDDRYLHFHLEKFLGAYGKTALNVEEITRQPEAGRRYVDEGRLARAFGHTENEVNEFVASLVLGKGIQSLVDLGCGPAALLRDLCRREPRFCGWGVDRSRMMCRRATDLIAAAGLSDRLRIINADVRQLKHHFEPGDRDRVDAIHGSSLFNEFVHSGGAGVVTLLNELQELFPGRLLFNVDYYGKLTAPTEVPSRLLHSVVMDVCQVLSAQGVPPGTREGWAILYQRAGCTLLEVHEAEADGIDAFVHVLRL